MRARLTPVQDSPEYQIVTISPTKSVTLGRRSDNDVVIRGKSKDKNVISRWHARIYHEAEVWYLKDDSHNGTYVNGSKVCDGRKALDNFSTIAIDGVEFEFTIHEDDEEEDNSSVETHVGAVHSGQEKTRSRKAVTASPRSSWLTTPASEPLALIRVALKELKKKTGADWAAFVSTDPENPLERAIEPMGDEPKPELSRRLNQIVRTRRCRVWLHEDFCGQEPGGSLNHCSDAICLPLIDSTHTISGNIHLYRNDRAFDKSAVSLAVELVDQLMKRLPGLLQWHSLDCRDAQGQAEDLEESDLVGSSLRILELQSQIEVYAPTLSPLLLKGEAGTGKECVARRIHQLSERPGNLVSWPCSAIKPGEAQATFYGQEQTPTRERCCGLLQRAEGGTLYLDEVADLPMDAQNELVSILDGTSRRGGRPQVDVRIVLSSSRNLDGLVDQDKFRQELRYRPLYLEVPRLCERREDIPALTVLYLQRLALNCNLKVPSITDAALEMLGGHHWPGNLIELESVLRAAILNSRGEEINRNHIRLCQPNGNCDESPPRRMSQIRHWAAHRAMRDNGYNKTAALEELGITLPTLNSWLNHADSGSVDGSSQDDDSD